MHEALEQHDQRSLTYPVVLATSERVVVLQLWKRIRIPRRLRRDEDRRASLDAAFRQRGSHERTTSRR